MAKLITYLLFSIFLTSNVLVNMDHGSIPAATTEISSYFSLSKAQLGALGTQELIGTTIGGITAGLTYQRLDAKYIQCIMMLIVSFLTVSFPYTSGVALYLCRFVQGFCQSFLTVYYTIWIDIFSPRRVSTLWMTILQLTTPIGIILGYLLTSLVRDRWTYSFYIQGFLYLPLSACLVFFPRRLITYKKSDALLGEAEGNFLGVLRGILRNQVYVCSFLCLSTLYFTVGGVQFWVSNYMETVLHMSKPAIVPVYTAIAFSAPTLGVVFGGLVCHQMGGYRDKKASGLCMLFICVAFVCALPSPWVRTWWLFGGFMWVVLFFGAAIVPILTGIMVHSLTHKLKQIGVPIASVLCNCVGYLPAPLAYGYICDLTGNMSSGMIFTLYWSVFGVLLMANIFRIARKANTII